jgi:hypothetical protein
VAIVQSSSNVEEWAERFRRRWSEFGFHTRPHGGSTVGEELVANTAEGIHERSLYQQHGGDRTPGQWPRNRGRYAIEKAKDVGHNIVNVYTGEMVSQDEIAGEVTMTSTMIVMRAGSGPEVVARAWYAHEQGRGYYELDNEIRQSNIGIEGHDLGEAIHDSADALGAWMRGTAI